jgi:hypothetical protein
MIYINLSNCPSRLLTILRSHLDETIGIIPINTSIEVSPKFAITDYFEDLLTETLYHRIYDYRY